MFNNFKIWLLKLRTKLFGRDWLYDPERGVTSEDWEVLCKPYAQKIEGMLPKGINSSPYYGYYAVVNDERGKFIVIGDQEFHGDCLAEAFQKAHTYLCIYSARMYAEKEEKYGL